MTDLMLCAHDILDEFKNLEEYQELKKMNKVITSLYQKEIRDFEEAKNKYQEVLDTGGSYHPDYKETIKKLSETKKTLYEIEDVKRYITLENEMQKKLNEIINQIKSSISDYIKAPNEIGIIHKGGHHGCK